MDFFLEITGDNASKIVESTRHLWTLLQPRALLSRRCGRCCASLPAGCHSRQRQKQKCRTYSTRQLSSRWS